MCKVDILFRHIRAKKYIPQYFMSTLCQVMYTAGLRTPRSWRHNPSPQGTSGCSVVTLLSVFAYFKKMKKQEAGVSKC